MAATRYFGGPVDGSAGRPDMQREVQYRHVPFIDEISPECEEFSNDNRVLVNDRLVPAKADGPDQLAKGRNIRY